MRLVKFLFVLGLFAYFAMTAGAPLKCGTDNVYHEARGEPFFGQLMVSWVVEQRRLENRHDWGGSTTCGVVYKEKQFSWTAKGGGHPFVEPITYVRAMFAFLLVRSGLWVAPSDLQTARYYLRPERSGAHGRGFFKTLVHVGEVGHHHFYREGDKSNVIQARNKPRA